MSTTFHVTVGAIETVSTEAARSLVLATGRRPVNFDKLLGKSKAWARVEMAVACTHADETCSTAEVFYARALSAAWNELNTAWGDEKKLAKNPVDKAFGGKLFDPGTKFVEWRDAKLGNDHPCPVLFVRLDHSPDVTSATFLVPEAWTKGISMVGLDCAIYGHHDAEAQRANNWRYAIEARPVKGLERIKPRGGVKKGYGGLAWFEGRVFAIDDDTSLVVELDAAFSPKPVTWFTRSAAMTGMWTEGDSLFVAKKKGGIEVRKDKIVASPKNTINPSYAGMRWLAAGQSALPLDKEGGGVGLLTFATRRGDEEWLVTRGGLIGRARNGAWQWFIADTPNATLAPIARGAALTDRGVIIAGAGGVYEVPLADLG